MAHALLLSGAHAREDKACAVADVDFRDREVVRSDHDVLGAVLPLDEARVALGYGYSFFFSPAPTDAVEVGNFDAEAAAVVHVLHVVEGEGSGVVGMGEGVELVGGAGRHEGAGGDDGDQGEAPRQGGVRFGGGGGGRVVHVLGGGDRGRCSSVRGFNSCRKAIVVGGGGDVRGDTHGGGGGGV